MEVKKNQQAAKTLLHEMYPTVHTNLKSEKKISSDMEIDEEDLFTHDSGKDSNEGWRLLQKERRFYEAELGHPMIVEEIDETSRKESPTKETPKYNPFS